MRLSPLSLLLVIPFVLAEPRTLQQITSDANRLLAEGAYLEASRSYSEAIDLDPNSYVNYYKRATAYLSLGKNNAALDDFDTILKLNPSFSQAHLQKAKILAKEGDFDTAKTELKLFGKTKESEEASELVNSITAASAEKKSALAALKSNHWDRCVEHATKALEVGINSIEIREVRLKCEEELGDVDAVYGDLSRLASLNPSALSLPLRLSHIAYFLLASPTATNHIKQCLHYDPDSAPCKRVHKLLRSLDKDTAKARNFVEGSSWRQAIKVLDGEDGLLARFDAALAQAIKEEYLPLQFEPKKRSLKRLELYALACKAAVGANDLSSSKGGKWCQETIWMDPENMDALVGQGEKLLKEEKYEEALRMFENAFEKSGRSSQDIMNRVQKAQKLLKISKQKDYYKVLGVPRDADERQIKKAFRTAAKNAHPDVGGSEEKMAALNEAYEVLSNPELRARYDSGDDPNDPHQGNGGGQNPFAHHNGGGMPFQFFQQGFPGGGGGQKMHFQWG
ncbi:hypothetical protein BCR39DRAFT_548578 [Naematelia encephala]|uniref:Tetratricopeptide repeat and J domain-containing co-chaperone DNJ1 n=1 Tax=Naematelia encephala TaxID=71784 RepID=A0A1Y2AND8_9TREE|nr:hypothetical protein BCR39DRAFT_548578 [Naematelia encephala]